MAFGNKMNNEGLKMKYFVSLLLVSFLIFHLSPFSGATENIKEPNVAGVFYPQDKKELTQLIQKYMAEAGDAALEGEPVVLISPHAGYIYSGPVAAYGFKAVAGRSFETVLILAATHYFPFKGAAVYPEGRFRTPLGDLDIDAEFAAALLLKDPKFIFSGREYFEQEHSLEAELPFLQVSLKPGFRIVPMILGDMTLGDCETLARILSEISREKAVLVLASTDLSHYRPYDEAVRYDEQTVNFIKSFDAAGLWNAVAHTGWNVCGIRPVVSALYYAKLKGAHEVKILKYANSGDTAGDKSKVVGYLSAVITQKRNAPLTGEGSMLTQGDKKRLLEIARATIAAHVSGKKIPVFSEHSPGLNLKRGAFVTLHKKGALRGCIGQFTSNEPLYRVISEMSIESATHDYRFEPVVESDLKEIDIEISVLSEPALIDDWRKIRLGTDGVIVRSGYSSGVFLPQVATETGWDLETFLGQLCSQKAGLPWDSYKNPSTKIYTFQADVFSEKEF